MLDFLDEDPRVPAIAVIATASRVIFRGHWSALPWETNLESDKAKRAAAGQIPEAGPTCERLLLSFLGGPEGSLNYAGRIVQ